jgi:hypothetical protein
LNSKLQFHGYHWAHWIPAHHGNLFFLTDRYWWCHHSGYTGYWSSQWPRPWAVAPEGKVQERSWLRCDFAQNHAQSQLLMISAADTLQN